MCRSVPQTEATLTLTRTSVGPMLGMGTSLISAPGLGSGFTTASMVSAIQGSHLHSYSREDSMSEQKRNSSTWKFSQSVIAFDRRDKNHRSALKDMQLRLLRADIFLAHALER